MASFIGLQQDSLEFRSNALISAYPRQKKESVWTQKARSQLEVCRIIQKTQELLDYCKDTALVEIDTQTEETMFLQWVLS